MSSIMMSNPSIASLPISAAWEVATAILTSDDLRRHHSFPSDFEVEFFAAKILKHKVIPLSAAHSLFSLILQLCFTSS
ncbi:hypothetical protein K1719_027508 [Acacia pycnantha]|nr:hypothetical protein K1719_027508 [Acacia pycnantha]